MSMQAKQFVHEDDYQNNPNGANDVKLEAYELNVIISPIFGLNHQKITPHIVVKHNNSTTLEQYVEQKTKENIFHEKEVAYNKTSSLDNSRIAQIQKNKEQQQIYDSLPSRYLEFREKIATNLEKTSNYSINNETLITTIDLLVDDILYEK